MGGTSEGADIRRDKRARFRLLASLKWAAAMAVALIAASPGRAVADLCADAGRLETAVVAAVVPGGELRLADGRTVRLVGFDPAQATPDRPDLADVVRADLGRSLVGRTVGLRVLGQKPDRWGRWAAIASIDAADVVTQALAAGLGRYLAEPASHACRDAFIDAERRARQAKLGLWADPYYGVLAVDDRAGFAERTGTVVLAEGIVAAVQRGPFRTTVRFAASEKTPRGARMLVATILPRVMKAFQSQRMDVAGLVGRRIRIRGLLDTRFGPSIGLDGPDDVELLDRSGDAAIRPPN